MNYHKDYAELSLYSEKIIMKRDQALKKITDFKNMNYKIVGYGAPAKATTLLNFFGINSNHIDCIIEDNPLKVNKIIPGTGIKIISKKELNVVPDIVIVFAWNFYESIVDSNKDLISKGAKFLSIKELIG